MGYFEFNEPYYALILANGLDEAIQVYESDVSEIEDEFPGGTQNEQYRRRQYKVKKSGCRVIPYAHALAKFYKGGEFQSVTGAENNMKKTRVLLIDGYLI